MNINRFLKCILLGGLATTVAILPVRALSGDKLAEVRAKAEAGDGVAQYDLALTYADPQASQANILEAYVWFTLAAENGAPGKAYMIVTNQMSPQQLIDGKKLLEQRRADLAAHRPTAAAPAEPDDTAITAKLAKAGADLAAAKKEAQQLKTELDKTHQTALDKLKAERDELAAAVAKSTNEISGLRAAAANFEGERNALKQQIADTSNSSKESKATFAADLATANAKLKTAENDLAKAESSRKELSTENQRLTNQNKETSTALAEKLAATEKKLNEAKAELLTTQGKLAEVTTQSAKTGSDNTALRTANTELVAQVQKLTMEKDQGLAQSIKAREEIETLNQKIKTVQTSAAIVTAINVDLAKEITELKAAQLATMREQLQQAQSQLASIAKEKAELKNRLSSTTVAPSAPIATTSSD
jgi:chromosome segregation ATPase